MSLQVYKSLKAAGQIIGACLCGYAMHLGADPSLGLAAIALIISGPEAFEYIVSQQNTD